MAHKGRFYPQVKYKWLDVESDNPTFPPHSFDALVSCTLGSGTGVVPVRFELDVEDRLFLFLQWHAEFGPPSNPDIFVFYQFFVEHVKRQWWELDVFPAAVAAPTYSVWHPTSPFTTYAWPSLALPASDAVDHSGIPPMNPGVIQATPVPYP
jgi:hypothetical protein